MDADTWDKLKESVRPLDTKRAQKELPPRLKVRRTVQKPISYSLDLHRMTVQEAYQKTVQFIEKHHKIGTKKIQIITGKGQNGQGLIRSEFANWLDTKTLKQYIRESEWTNDKGAMDIWLNKHK